MLRPLFVLRLMCDYGNRFQIVPYLPGLKQRQGAGPLGEGTQTQSSVGKQCNVCKGLSCNSRNLNKIISQWSYYLHFLNTLEKYLSDTSEFSFILTYKVVISAG